MRQTTFLAATVSLFATLTFAAGTALAQSTPAPAQSPPAPAQPTPSQAHMQGMDHGGQQMHDQMMRDHQAGMQNQQDQQGSSGMSPGPGMSGMSGMSNGAGMAGKPKSACCKRKKPAPHKPAAQPMPADKPMSDM